MPTQAEIRRNAYLLKQRGASIAEIEGYVKGAVAGVAPGGGTAVAPVIEETGEVERERQARKRLLVGSLPVLGATVGGFAAGGPGGGLAGFARGVAGAAVGGAAGEAVRQPVSLATGLPVPETTGKALKQVGKEAVYGGLQEAGGRAISGSIVGTAKLLKNLFSRVGVSLPGGFYANIKTAEGTAALAKEAERQARLPYVEKISKEKTAQVETRAQIESGYESAEQQIGKKLNETVAGFESAPTRVERGQILKDEMAEFVHKGAAKSKELYDKIPSDIPLSPEGLQTPLEFSTEMMFALSKEITPAAMKQINDMVLSLRATGGLTFGSLKQARTTVGTRISWSARGGGDYENRLLKSLYYSLTDDLDRAAAQGGFTAEYKAASSHFREFRSAVETNSLESIRTTNPENIISEIVRPDGITGVREIYGYLGEKAKRAVQAEVISNLAEKSSIGGKFSADTFYENVSKYSPDTLQTIFGNKYKQVADFVTASQALLKSSRITELATQAAKSKLKIRGLEEEAEKTVAKQLPILMKPKPGFTEKFLPPATRLGVGAGRALYPVVSGEYEE